MATVISRNFAAALAIMLAACSTAPTPVSTPEPIAQTAVTGVAQWQCELGQSLQTKGDWRHDQRLTLTWKNRVYELPRQRTETGAHRFYDPYSGLDLLVIPGKAMLLNRKAGNRLADACQTTAMEPIPTGEAPTLLR